ncbi:MAG: PilX N-terminal domain-containing pilus assembly protein [Gammaproteobacteria bacterium]|nr:PilX N-terminal domain-containing pilus assembly protein [Gammaproteobacteria bacterium]
MHHTSISKQHGAALIVGLVLLMVLTLLAVSTMRTASLELMMAGNSQARNNAFQLAETGLEAMLAQIESGAITLQPVAGWQQPLAPNPTQLALGNLQGQFDATVSYVGVSIPWDGSSQDVFQFDHYRVDAEGATTTAGVETNRSGRSNNVQGIYQVNPVVQGVE